MAESGLYTFHLTSARESKSFEQFVWTFSYAKSFVSLLVNLCTQLTAAGQLQDLDPGKLIGRSMEPPNYLLVMLTCFLSCSQM